MNLRLSFLLWLVALPLLAASAAHAQGISNSGPVDITSTELDVQQTRGLAIFTGNVVLTQGTFRLEAPKLTATYNAAGGKGAKEKSPDVQSIEAVGGVIITRGEGASAEKAVGTTALYSPATQQMIMTGAVTLNRGPSQLSGDKLVYDMASGNARVTNSKGPVKARFVPAAK